MTDNNVCLNPTTTNPPRVSPYFGSASAGMKALLQTALFVAFRLTTLTTLDESNLLPAPTRRFTKRLRNEPVGRANGWRVPAVVPKEKAPQRLGRETPQLGHRGTHLLAVVP
eukprot:6612437-Pyramimonas_sp.AAC.2